MTRARLFALVVALAAGTALWTQWPAPAGAFTPGSRSLVKLYSNGQQVGQWEAVSQPRVEGHSLAFAIRKGTRDLEVRIHGTYSVEEQL